MEPNFQKINSKKVGVKQGNSQFCLHFHLNANAEHHKIGVDLGLGTQGREYALISFNSGSKIIVEFLRCLLSFVSLVNYYN